MIFIQNENDAQKAISVLKGFGNFTEYPHSTEMYGIGYWIKKRFKIPQFIKLENWEINHGPPYANKVDQSLLNSRCHLLLYNNHQKKEYDKAGRRSIVVGSSFVHCRKINHISKTGAEKGTIFFPIHTTNEIDMRIDWDKYAKSIVNLPENYQPVSVCLYYREIISGIYKHFLNNGITIYCAGHMLDSNFPLNFYRILQQFKYSSSNSPCSSGYYSIEMGIPFFLFGESPQIFNHGNDPNYPENIISPIIHENIVHHDLISEEVRMMTYDLNSKISISKELKEYIDLKLGCNENQSTIKIQFMIWTRYIRFLIGRLINQT